MGALYSIDFPNGKRYIGVTTLRASQRFRQHRADANRGTDSLVHRALRAHGVDKCLFRILVVADGRDYLAQLEQRAVEAFNTLTPNGYNCIPGGGIGTKIYRMPESERAKRRGRTASPEARAKMSAARLGKKRPESYRVKLSERSKGNTYAHAQRLTRPGVSHRKSNNTWSALINVDKQRIYLGTFPTREEAVAFKRFAALALIACP